MSGLTLSAPSHLDRGRLERIAAGIVNVHRATPGRSALVAISGIDGCGKGYVSSHLSREIAVHGAHVAVINVDGWLNLPCQRFNKANPAEHFYLHAIRFDDMFETLVLPLRDRRSLRVETDFVEETASTYRRHLYEFYDVDIILLEGIYLLKQQFQQLYDISFWIECSFDTALKRAIARAQEGLSPQETAASYRTIYFPAQEIHFSRDHPRSAASGIFDND
jgi:uridine kinase